MARIVSYVGSDMDPDIKEMRPNLYNDPLYYRADVRILSQMTEGVAAIANTRNTISATWEVGWEEEEYEVILTYNRYINRSFCSEALILRMRKMEQGEYLVLGISCPYS